MKKFYIIISFAVGMLMSISANAQFQYGMNPNDPDVIFTSSNQPALPAWNNYAVIKWGHSNRLSWNPYAKGYRSYLYQNMAFRLKYPKTYQHNVADGKKYPLLVFFHGRGEYGTVYDNEYQLLHGGELHAGKVNDGTFDGFLLYIQSTTGNTQDYFSRVNSLLDTMVKSVKLDIDRIIISGLSAGGQSSWDWFATDAYAKKGSASIPMSAASILYPQYFPSYITVPFWVSNGGQDAAPAPYTVTQVITAFRDLGGNMRQSYYPALGHGIWNTFWAEPDYWPFLNAQHKANPLIYFQRNEFCPNDSVSAKLAVQPGFAVYEWQKNGITITGATTNEYIATSFGTYKVRFKRTSTGAWSEWSPKPAVISAKQGTVSPPIQIDGLASKVLPAPNGATTTPLIVPNTFASYEWRRVSDNAVVSTNNTYVAPAGQYKVKVTEQYGCSSNFSDVFTVINAAGTNVPDKASNVSAMGASSNAIQLDWNDNPSPLYNETAFEIYRSTSSGTGYQLIAIKGADVLSHLDENLLPNTTYFYIVRAVNNNGAAVNSTETSGKTKSDFTKPSAPLNLRVLSTTPSTVTLQWDESTDDVGVVKYDIYINGSKSFATSELIFTVPSLTYQQSNAYVVRARDASGNISPASNQITAAAKMGGLTYKYYEGNWSVLPDFNTLTPTKTGVVPNVSITEKLRNDEFAFLWEGFIRIPVTGSYTFETNSDDGSKLYIGKYSHTATALVNNDGLHGGQYRSGTITLNAGVYPIAITFFEQGGGETMSVYWTSSAAGIPTRQLIPNSALVDNAIIITSNLPAKPSNLFATAVSHNRINLSWTDNSNNETGFELVRSTSQNGLYIPIGTTDANVTTFADSTDLQAATKYFYNVRAINNSGVSANALIIDAEWTFDNTYADATGTSRTLTPSGSPVFSSADIQEGTHSVNFTSTTNFADMPFSTGNAFPSNAYGTRTVALWVKPAATTISAANKIIIDLGGSDNGLAIRFHNGSLEAGISRSGTRSSASVAGVISNSSWVANGWNHVAAVYNGSTLKLFINGAEKATSTLATPGTTVSSSTSLSRIAASNGSNAFNSSTSGTNYIGLMDEALIVTDALSATAISSIMNQSLGGATTLSLPALPVIPTAATATAISTDKVVVKWNDNSGNETGFEIYRSVGSDLAFRFVATVAPGAGGQMSYTDNNLFANTNYYYKVRSTGVGGNSAFTANVLARTPNNNPEIANAGNISMRHSSQRTISFSATDMDAEPLTITALNTPTFGTFTSSGNTASLVLSPNGNDQGIFTMSVIATDGNGGADTATFTITVNNNFIPVIAPVSGITVNEGSNTNVSLSATDQDGNASLVWSMVSGAPFANFTSTVAGSGTLNLQPNFAQAGIYNAIAKVVDGNGGEETVNFTITVLNTEPSAESVYMSMQYNSAPAAAPWNNINTTTVNNLKNSNGQVTPISIQFLNTSWNAGDAGAVTGNNSGVYPDAVIKDYFWFGNYGAPETVNVQLSGLVANNKYDLTFLASSSWFGVPDNGITVYTIGGVSKSLYAQSNNQNTVTFGNVVASATGTITVNMSKGPGAPYGMVNAIVLQKPFDDGSAPVKPTNLTGVAQPNGTIKLTWTDLAYNEDRYLVYRSTSAAGPFNVLNAGAANSNETSYTDNNVSTNNTYYYKIEAINNNGTSGLTDAVSVTVGNKAPTLPVIADVFVKGGASKSISFTASDDASDILTVSISNLPSFALYQNTGNGKGTITFNPTINDIGVYNNLTVNITDNFGLSTARTFRVFVSDSSIRSAYVNFGVPGGKFPGAPWNNWTIWPYGDVPLANLVDDANNPTSFGVRLTSTWDGNFQMGMITGNNSGIYPDDVIETGIHSTANVTRVVQVEGLNPARRYNIVVFSSQNTGISQSLTASTGSQNITFEPGYNSNKSFQFNGLTPNAAGQIQVNLTKSSTATYLVLNALVIQEYTTTTPLIRPFDLFAESVLDTNKIKLSWSDRSSNETGFQVYRSTAFSGPFTLMTTTSANVTTFTDGNVLPNTRYYYRVRSVSSNQFSNFSNVVSKILAKTIVFVNFNATPAGNGPLPWNNTNGPSVSGATFPNLFDNTLNNSGMSLIITKEFNGPGFGGVNGTGVLPGAVMESNYWTDAGQLSQVKFTGLNISKKYRVGIFGSAIFVGGGYSVAVYNCNGKTVYLNSLYNKAKVVYLEDLMPNEDGELIIDARTQNGSPYSFTGAFTLEGYDDVTGFTPVATSGRSIQTETPDPALISAPVSKSVPMADPIRAEILTGDINVYPNPFSDKIQVDISAVKSSDINMVLYDITGKIMYNSNAYRSIAGKNTYRLNLPNGASIQPGSYILNIIVDGKLTKSIRLIKVN